MISKRTTGAPIDLPLLCLGRELCSCARKSGNEYSFRRGGSLVQKRQLLLPLNDPGGSFSNEPFERSGEVCLVEVTKTANYIKNRNTLSEQDRCVSRSLHLSERSIRNACRSEEMSLCRTQ